MDFVKSLNAYKLNNVHKQANDENNEDVHTKRINTYLFKKGPHKKKFNDHNDRSASRRSINDPSSNKNKNK